MDDDLKKVLILSFIIFIELIFIGAAFLNYSPDILLSKKAEQNSPIKIITINLSDNDKDVPKVNTSKKKLKKRKKKEPSVFSLFSSPTYSSDSSSSKSSGEGKQFNEKQRAVFSSQ